MLRSRSRLVALLLASAAVLVVVVLLTTGGSDDPPPGPAAAQTRPAAGPVLDARSIARALARLDRALEPGELLFEVSIRPEETTALVATSRTAAQGRFLLLPVGEDAEVSSRAFYAAGPGVPPDQLDRRGPVRLAAAAARALGPRGASTPPSVIDLQLAAEGRSRVSWELRHASGPSWTGDVHGRRVVGYPGGAPAPPAGTAGPAVVPTGLNATSLLREANLRRALTALDGAAGVGGQAVLLDVAPALLRSTVAREGRQVSFETNAAFGVIPGRSDPAYDDPGAPLATVDAGAPERALRTIAQREGQEAGKDVRSVQFRPAAEDAPASWTLEFRAPEKAPVTWRASADGATVQRADGSR